MLQKTAAGKSHQRLSILDHLSAGFPQKRELEKDLDYLKSDYSALLETAANLSSHSRWIPYHFLIDRLKKIADEVRSQAELVRMKIVELGGNVPQVNIDTREEVEFRQNVRRLVGDMEEHAAVSEALVHQKNNINDPGILQLVVVIASRMQGQRDELMDTVMRLS